jgi:hypothetical protein
MGTSAYTYHVRDRTQAQCLEALSKARSPQAFVSPQLADWSSVMDVDGDAMKSGEFEARAATVSKVLGADVIVTGVFDDDISWYVAFKSGKQIDRFCSGSDEYDDAKPVAGNPARLAKSLSWWDGQANLAAVLKKKYRIESSRLKDIVRAFGIPEHRALTTFGDLLRPLPAGLVESLPPVPRSGREYAALPVGEKFGAGLRERTHYVEFKAE